MQQRISPKLTFASIALFIFSIFLLLLWKSSMSKQRPAPAVPKSDQQKQSSWSYRVTWTPGPEAPVGMMEGPCIQVGNLLFVMGGFTAALYVTQQANVLDLDTMRWISIPPLPQSQTHVGIASDGKYLYLVG